LGDFVGTTTTLTGEMVGGPTLAEVRGWVEAPVATLTTGNGRRDKDLNKSMQSDSFPTMRFDLDQVRPQWERNDSAGVELQGRFTIHGVEQERAFDAVVLFEGEALRLRATLPLNLKDYKIRGLSKFLGTLKMHPDIVVHVDVEFGQ
jgi:polyisoprenoid-binding protein YceI